MAAQDLTLAEYACVQAHVAERHPLANVLPHLGIDEARWSLAEQTFSRKLVSDPALFKQYTGELERAVDALERRVRPLDEDAGAWLTFLAAYAAQKEPFAWLERQDLGVSDLARLNRLWERRCREDGDVAKQYAALAKDASSRPLSPILVDPRKPLGSGAPSEAPRAETAGPRGAGPAGRPSIDLFTYATLVADLAMTPARRGELLADHRLNDKTFAATQAWYAARFEAAPEERRDFDRLVDHNQERAARARQGAAPPEASRAAAARPASVPLAEDDLDSTGELNGAILARSLLPFRAATAQDAERMAHAAAPVPDAAADEAADSTGEVQDAPLARPLPFAAKPAPNALKGTMPAGVSVLAAALPFAREPRGGAPPPPAPPPPTEGAPAIVTSYVWRGADGRSRTTILGKLTLYLQPCGPPVPGPSEPFVAFDRIAVDRRFVDEASETAPWSVLASILAYAGPLRFTFHPAGGEPLQVTAGRGAPVGRSMSNPERARYAAKTPTRGADGILTIPDEIDGRYFVVAPPTQQTAAIVGDERVVLEVGGAPLDTKLPALVIVATVDVGGQRRAVRLPFDTLAVHGERRRIALVARATLPGEATIVGHTLSPLRDVVAKAASKAADRPRGKPLASTAAFDASAMLRAVMPFDGSPRQGVPPAPPPPAPPSPPPPPAQAEAPARIEAAPPPADAPAPDPAAAPKHVIASKRGAMAKPRVKRH